MTCAFPLFRERFFAEAKWASAPEGGAQQTGPAAAPTPAPEAPPSPTRGPLAASKGLAALDLSAINRGEQEPDELQARREKFARFEKLCSEVYPGLFVAGDPVARNRDILAQAGITHVINCVGFLYPAYFQGELCYKTLHLYDTPHEDITTVLYDVFDFIEEARAKGGRVLIHCSQGVSRSMTLAIAFLMWREGCPFDVAFRRVKDIRGIANPNVGFTCQLLTWDKRRQAALAAPRLYRIAPHSPAAPTYLVPKLLPHAALGALDPRGAFVAQLPEATYVWQGERCSPAWAEAAQACARALAKYERASAAWTTVQQGEEPPALLAALGAAPGAAPGPGAPRGLRGEVAEVAAYTPDHRAYSEGLRQGLPLALAAPSPRLPAPSPRPVPSPRPAPQQTPRGGGPRGVWDEGGATGGESSRRHFLSERSLSGSGGRPPKTPRSETGDAHGDTSPNQRQRKKGRGELDSSGSLPDLDAGGGDA